MRNSNIEVLRLIAMFFIVLSHILKGSFQTLDTNLIEGTLSSNSIFLVDSVLSSLTCAGVGVDLFVLISGYFSIRFKLKSFVQLLFQILFVRSDNNCFGSWYSYIDYFRFTLLCARIKWHLVVYIKLYGTLFCCSTNKSGY